MAESEIAQHIQFGEEIRPVKTIGSSKVYKKGGPTPSLSEKPTSYDDEEQQGAAHIANADLNHKKKQVSSLSKLPASTYDINRIHSIDFCRNFQTISNLFLDLYRVRHFLLCIPDLEAKAQDL